ncbi:MAG: hypothetical protein QXG35_08870 [Nitrososphaerota archaeon]
MRIEEIMVGDKILFIYFPNNRRLEISWCPLSTRISLWIDDAYLSFRADDKVYDRVINPIIKGDDRVIDAVKMIAGFKSSKTQEKYIHLMAYFGIEEAMRWLGKSPIRYFLKIAEVKDRDDRNHWIAGSRRPWGSVFVAKLGGMGSRVFIVTLDPEPKMYFLSEHFFVKDVDTVYAIKLAEGSASLGECRLSNVYSWCLSDLSSFREDVLNRLYIDAVLINEMILST